MSLGIFYPSQVGGPGNTLYWLGKELVKRNVAVTAVVTDLGISSNFALRDKWYNLEGITIKYCNSKKPFLIFKIIWQTLKQVPYNDVIMLSSIFYKPNFFVGIMALIMSKKVIWSPRGELLVQRGWVKKSYLYLLKILFAKRVIYHVTSQEEMASVHKFMGKTVKCVLIPNYMELPKKIRINSTDKYLLYVGRIMPIKALDKLIEGASLSKLFMSQDYKLYLAGKNEGEYYQRLVALINQKGLTNKIIFKGMVEGEDKERLFAGAKVTMLVSNTENFGNVIIESLAQGTPAITSKGTPWQILNKKQAGFWIENTPFIIGQTIDKLLGMSNDDYQQMRKNAYELCSNKFDIKTNIENWIEILNKNYISCQSSETKPY